MESSDSLKSDNVKKQEIMKELQLLSIKEQNIERERCTHLYDRRRDVHSELSMIQQQEQSMTTSRKTNRMKMHQQLTRAKNAVCKFQQELQHIQQITPTVETVQKLKVAMEEIESLISNIREQQKVEFDELMRDERLLSQEVDALNKRFDMWSLPGGADGITAAADGARSHRFMAPPSSRDITADLPPEVAAFEIFLQQTGGHQGGWDEYDHATFLKYRNRHKGKLSFIKELAGGLIPTQTEQEIRDHEAWYQEYLLHIDRKKEAIQKWREKKEIEKDEAAANAEKFEKDKEKISVEEMERRRQEAEKEKQEQLKQLSQWKVERELRKAQEEEQQLKLQLQKQRKIELDKQRQIEVKKKVNEYKMLKELEDEEKKRCETERLQMELIERQQEAAELISRFRDRDLEAIREKRDHDRLEKLRLEQEKQQRLDKLRSQVEVYVERDPQRLLRPTEGWRQRQKDSGPSGSGPLLHIPRRATPSWRQGLS